MALVIIHCCQIKFFQVSQQHEELPSQVSCCFQSWALDILRRPKIEESKNGGQDDMVNGWGMLGEC